MAILQKILSRERIHTHSETKNFSFIKMHANLKKLGVKNNKFFLALYDPALKNIDPHDENLSMEMKARVLKECSRNFWYFIREVIRIKVPGGIKRYELHRGNLALSFCMANNISCYLELPRQNYKTISAVAFYLWVYNFSTKNSQIMFMNKKLADSKNNLKRLKDMLDELPTYMRLDHMYGDDGKLKKGINAQEKVFHPMHNNEIVAKASATSEVAADGLGRGNTQPLQWYDEFAFLKFNDIIYDAATPAFSQASLEAQARGKPFGITITSTPGDMMTNFGQSAKDFIENAADFQEKFYDMTPDDIRDYLHKNGKNNFVYIKYSYLEIGRDQAWFERQCRDLRMNWEKIRREILIEWNRTASNSPFNQEELDVIEEHLLKGSPKTIFIDNYPIYIYDKFDLSSPPIIGVDVSGGYRKDSSAFVQISTKTGKVQAVFNSSAIGIREFSVLILQYVQLYVPNAVVSIERNSYGEGVISNLRSTAIKRNLYYQYKTNNMNEKVKNGFVNDNSGRTLREYGVYTNGNSRDTMMEILREWVTNHKDKFISKIIFNELCGLEMRNGRIDHGPKTHDDTVMSLLIGLYTYFHGTNLHEFGVVKHHIKTDSNLSSVDEYVNEIHGGDIIGEANIQTDIDLSIINTKASSKSMRDFYREIEEENLAAREALERRLGMSGDPDGRVSLTRNDYQELNGLNILHELEKETDMFNNHSLFRR